MTKKKRGSEPKARSKSEPESPSSEPTDAAPAESTRSAESTPPAEPSKSPAVVRKPKRFRRTRIALWIIVPAIIAFRVVLAVSIAPILERVAESYGLEARYENLSLSLLGADVELWHLIIVDSQDDAELVHVEYCRADLSVLDLLRGRVVVKRVEADGLDVFIERNEKGRLPALDRLLARAKKDAPAEKPVEPRSGGSLAPKNLEPPVRVDALRLQHVLVHVRDRSVSPPLDTRIHTNVRLSNIGHPVHRPRFSFEVNAEGVLDGLWVEGVASAESEHLVADLDVDLRNLYLEPLRPYLARAGFEPIAERWSGRFHGKADITSGSRDDEPYLDAHLTLADAGFGVAGGDRWTLDTVQLHVELTQNEVRFHGGRVAGGRALARRAATGQVELLGLRTIDPVREPIVAPTAESTPTGGSPVAESAPSAPPSAPEPGPILRGFESFVFEDLQARIIDQRVEPTSEFLFSLDRLALESTGDETLSIQGAFRAPGLAERGQVEGKARLALPRSHLDLAVTTEGIDPNAAKLQLDSARLESILESGLIQFRIEAGLEITRERLSSDFALRDFAFNDQQQWAGVGAMRVEGVQVDRATGGLHVDEIAIESPQLEVRRDRDEHIVALGLRWDPNPAPPTERAETEKNDPKAAPPVAPPKPARTRPKKAATSRPPIHVARVRWTDTKIRYSDESIDGSEPLEISDLGIEVDDLFIADAPGSDAPRGQVRGWIALPGVAESLRLDGTLTPIPGGTRLEAKVTGENLNGDRLGPYLATVGMKETFDSGSLELALIAHFSMEGETLRAGLELRGFELRDGDVTWLACGSLEIPQVTIEQGRIAIEPVAIDAPRLRVARHDDGTWETLGVRTLSNRLDKEKTAEVLDQPPPPPPDLGAAPTIQFGGLRLTGATLQLVDAKSQRDWLARTDFELAPFAWSKELSRSEWSLKASIDGAAESITVDGDLRASHDRFGAALAVRARGIGHELANALLPPELRVELADGEFAADVSFQSQTHEAGGQSLNTAIRDVRLWEGDREHLKLDIVEADVQRVDLIDRVIEIGAVRATGLALRSSRDEAGVIRALGIAVHPASPQREAPPTRTEAGASATAAAAPPPSQRARSIWQTPPHLSVAEIELGASSIEWFDATTMAEPIRLEELVLESVEPWAALGNQESFPPLQLRVVGRVEPGLATLETHIALSPFSTPLFVEVTPALREIDGAQFDRVFAPIEHQVSLAGLEAGDMEAKLVVSLALARRSPLEFDFSRSFTGELELSGARLRDGEETWVGVDAVRVTGVRFDLPREVRIADIEIDRPHGRVDRTPDGILAFGARVPDPTRPETSRDPKPNGSTPKEARPSDAESSAKPSETESASSAPGTTPSTPSASPPPARVGQVALAERTTRSSGPIITIERVTVSGLDFEVNDTTTEHEMHLPFTGLDVLVQDITTHRRPEKPVRFNLFLEAGRARAPGAKTETPVMGELNLAGDLQLGKPLVGNVRMQIVQFDLAHLRGPAQSLDITLTDGFLDFETELVFREDGQLLGDTLAVFTDLSVSEGENGPIRRLLKLPTPVNVALILVRDASNAVRIPVEFQLDPEYVSLVEITRATVTAMGTVLATAIASSPLRVGGAFTDLVGLTGSEKLVDPEPPVDLSFAPGELTTNWSTRNVVDELIARMKREPKLQLVLEHELGQADLEVARRRANPPVERSRQLVEQLRSRRRELLAERPRLAGAAYSSLLADVHQRSDEALRVLQTTDNELGLIERSLDRLYDLIEPGGEHRALKRQREAAVAMARARIDGVLRRITDRGVDSARLRVRPPRFAEPTVDGGGRVRVVPSLIESPRR